MRTLGMPLSQRRLGAWHISRLRILPANDGTDIVRFEASCVGSLPEEGALPAIVVLDGNDHPSQLSDPVLVGSSNCELATFPGVPCRRLCLSVRISSGLEKFSLVVGTGGATEAILDVTASEAKRLRDAWWSRMLPAELDEDYGEWFKRHHLTVDDYKAQRIAQHDFAVRPLFSIIVPLFKTPLEFFREMAESVLVQTYERFELILVNASPEDAPLCRACAELALRDDRVQVITLDGNRGITENTNAGIDAAKGDFLAFFDHDDLLEPDCLYWYVKGINDYPETDLLYCDEDKLENGSLGFPFFKPDYDRFFLETNNYVCHLLTVRASLARSLPRPTAELDGAQDHSMALAAGDVARNIYHVRRVLYHWRVHASSTAGNVAAKPESLDAGRIAIERHLSRLGEERRVTGVPGMPHYYRVVATQETPPVAALLYGEPEAVERRVAKLVSDGTDAVPVHGRGGLVSAFIEAVERLDAPYVALLSASVEPVGESCLSALAAMASRKGVGIAAPVTLYPDGTVQDAGVACSLEGTIRPVLRDIFFDASPQIRGLLRCAHTVSAARGHCMVVERSLLRELLSALDGCPGLFWDIALCLEARRKQGLATLVVPSAVVRAPMPSEALAERADEVVRAYVRARAWLYANWPEFFSDVDRFYNRQLRQDGCYGLSDYC
ncbi:MAG TPA: glycosyltransferase [Candidatus Olsenella pullistercoris]|uniref:Glycosyltransferase n=1 Tax=Candidatus Olsenella pullistercoris TaxID=2838712 RepID=A0A9D2JDP7_9ACTN|nr:glycosyltransferase [Candidatus Olsenella pullistercoris]